LRYISSIVQPAEGTVISFNNGEFTMQVRVETGDYFDGAGKRSDAWRFVIEVYKRGDFDGLAQDAEHKADLVAKIISNTFTDWLTFPIETSRPDYKNNPCLAMYLFAVSQGVSNDQMVEDLKAALDRRICRNENNIYDNKVRSWIYDVEEIYLESRISRLPAVPPAHEEEKNNVATACDEPNKQKDYLRSSLRRYIPAFCAHDDEGEKAAAKELSCILWALEEVPFSQLFATGLSNIQKDGFSLDVEVKRKYETEGALRLELKTGEDNPVRSIITPGQARVRELRVTAVREKKWPNAPKIKPPVTAASYYSPVLTFTRDALYVSGSHHGNSMGLALYLLAQGAGILDRKIGEMCLEDMRADQKDIGSIADLKTEIKAIKRLDQVLKNGVTCDNRPKKEQREKVKFT